MMLGFESTPQRVAELRQYFGLDRPWHIQYFEWLGAVLQGDLGKSLLSGARVDEMIMARFPATLQLTLASMFVALSLALPVGILAAIYPRTMLDTVGTLISVVGLSVPHFWLATLLILLVAVRWELLPVAGYVPFAEAPIENLRHLVLPALSLGIAYFASIARQLRSSLMEVMDTGYIRTAHAKGLGSRAILFRHALKNASIPVLTVAGVQVGRLLGGVIVIEQIFSWPGIGTLGLYAINQRDYPVLQGVVLLVAGSFVAINLLVDLAYPLVDPRIRHS